MTGVSDAERNAHYGVNVDNPGYGFVERAERALDDMFPPDESADMNNTNPTIYLAGPINGCTDEQANDWRTYIKDNYDGPTLDPMRRDYRGREDECVEEIVELDKVDVEACDVFMANCPNPSYGTAMEIFYAWQAYKPVVIIHPADKPVSPWVRYHSDAIVHTLDDAIAAAQELSTATIRLVETVARYVAQGPDWSQDPSRWDDEHARQVGL